MSGKSKKLTIIINRNANFVLQYGQQALAVKIKTILHGHIESLHFAAPKSIPNLLDKADKETYLLIGGGDGTIHLAADHLMKTGVSFGVLPFGTMNLFARDIGLDPDPIKAIESYRHIRTRIIDTVQGNGKTFLCNAMIGIDPTLVKEREKARSGKKWYRIYHWPSFMARLVGALLGRKKHHLALIHDGEKDVVDIQALIVSNNCYIKDPESPEDRLKKNSLTDGKLAIYAVDTNSSAESLGLLARVVFGRWQADSAIQSFETTRLKVTNSKKRLHVMLDGELYYMTTPVKFAIIPKSLKLLVPDTATERSTPS